MVKAKSGPEKEAKRRFGDAGVRVYRAVKAGTDKHDLATIYGSMRKRPPQSVFVKVVDWMDAHGYTRLRSLDG